MQLKTQNKTGLYDLFKMLEQQWLHNAKSCLENWCIWKLWNLWKLRKNTLLFIEKEIQKINNITNSVIIPNSCKHDMGWGRENVWSSMVSQNFLKHENHESLQRSAFHLKENVSNF